MTRAPAPPRRSTPCSRITASIIGRLPEAWSSMTSRSPASAAHGTSRARAQADDRAARRAQNESVITASPCRSSEANGPIATPKSTSPDLTLRSTSLWTSSRKPSEISGNCRRHEAMTRGISRHATVGLAATITRPRRCWPRSRISRSASSRSDSSRDTLPTRFAPTSVSCTSRVVRSISLSPISPSSSRTHRLTADCVRPISSPARLKLRSRATSIKTRSCRNVTFERATHSASSSITSYHAKLYRAQRRRFHRTAFRCGAAKMLRARRMGLLHLIGDCPDFLICYF